MRRDTSVVPMLHSDTLLHSADRAMPSGRLLSTDAGSDAPPLESLLSSVVCRVLRAGWFPCAPEWRLAERVIPNYILFICVGGGADFLIGGRPYRLDPGGVVLTPPHVPQAAHHHPADPLQVYAIHFVARLYGVLDMPALYELPVALRPAPARMQEIVQAAQRIVCELAGREPGRALLVNGECARILALLWRESVAQGLALTIEHRARTAEVARLAPVFRAIHSRYAEPLTLEELAGIARLHPAYFSSLFKRVTGLPPLRYVARYRLDRVRELLLATDKPLAEIATLTGYRDAAYLSRVFRQAEGMSPGEYRRAKKSTTFP
jgi:AraC family transcriptional regulator of arabinose operon